MDSMAAMAMGRAAKAAGATIKVFDWDKAAQIIKERKPQRADAGLAGDFEYTRGTIYRDGQIVTDDDVLYLASNWAAPTLILDDSEEIVCSREEAGSGWDAKTKWPESARHILVN